MRVTRYYGLMVWSIYAFSIGFVAGLTSATCVAQECPEGLLRTSPDSRFGIYDNGVALDRSTGLRWSRCLVGQTFSDNRCLGEPKLFDIRGYIGYMSTINESYDKDGHMWRLPNIKELASIAERGCSDPAVNLQIFPDTPKRFAIYSSTPYAGDKFYTIDLITGEQKTSTAGFGIGGVSSGPALGYSKNYIRLVSDQ